jgi:hypothetical protein
MNENNSVVAVYVSHTAAELAIKELQRSGFDMKKLSIVGRDYQTDEQVVGYYNTGDRIKAWGKTGALGYEHIEALSHALAVYGELIRATIKQAAELDDPATADIFTQISRSVDKNLWFIEAHNQAEK